MPDMPEYQLVRSARRTVSLEVTRDLRLLVRAPNRMPRAEIDAFVSAHGEWAARSLEKAHARAEAHPTPTQAQQEAWIARAKELLPSRVAFYAGQMGLQPAGITITGAATRFGSCSPKNRLSFSWRLMDYPEAAIDYVVVHELAHIRQKNHSRAFYALVAAVLPDYRDREALLKHS